MIGGVSTLGEELGWRGFLQGSLRPLGRVRGYLVVALMWEAWHFTSHLKGTLTEVVSRMSIYTLSSSRLCSFWALSSSARILFCSPSRYTSGSILLSTVVEPT
jgi:membrane protease YdiL (CAAX protease family)